MHGIVRIWGAAGLVLALACGGGASPERASASDSPTWAETPTDPTAATVPAAWRTWIEQHHLPLKSLDPKVSVAGEFEVWKPSLAGKRLVMLGESSHGAGEFSAVKVRLIKFLHEELGFDVLVFESSIMALHVQDKIAGTADPVAVMQGGIFGVWNTAETAELFRYIQATRATAHPLLLAGMDIQPTSRRNDGRLEPLLQTLLAGQDAARLAEVTAVLARTDELFLMDEVTQNATLLAEGHALSARIQALVDWMDPLLPRLVATAPDPRDPRIARQALWSRGRHVEHLTLGAEGQASTSFATRDQGMAENLQVLAETVYPGRKLIVWAHNAHILNHSNDPAAYEGSWSGFPCTGTLTKAHFGPEVYTVGLFMYRGASNGNDGTPIPVAKAGPGSLEALLYRTRRRAALVELTGSPTDPGTAWMRTFIPTLYWGSEVEHMVPQAQFDALCFVDTTHPSVYLPRVTPPGPMAPEGRGSASRALPTFLRP